MADLEATIVIVTRNLRELERFGQWLPTANLAERTISARVKWQRQSSSLRFPPAVLNATLDISDGLYPATAETEEELLRSEIYVAVKATVHPIVIFHGWITRVKWKRSDGPYLQLQLVAADCLGELQNVKCELSDAPSGDAAALVGAWTAHRWLVRAGQARGIPDFENLNRLRALYRGLWWASPTTSEGPGMVPREGYFETTEEDEDGNIVPRILNYPQVLEEIRHQTQGRIGVAHGWEARYPHPDPTLASPLDTWGTAVVGNATDIVAGNRPLPSYLGAEYVGLLWDPTTAFVTATHPAGHGDRKVLFSEKTRDATTDQKPQYRGHQWTISNEEVAGWAAEPEEKNLPNLTNSYQRSNIVVTNRSSAGPDYFVDLDPENSDFLAGAGEETVTTLANTTSTSAAQHAYSWSNWLAFADRSPKLSHQKVSIPLHFLNTAEHADAILRTNLWTKVRVRLGSRAGQLLDRQYHVDGVEWEFQSFASRFCGLGLKVNLLELPQETPLILDHQPNADYQQWNQSELNNGNVLVA